MQDLGLEPANLNALKPVLINSKYIAKAEEGENPSSSIGFATKSFASKFLVVRNTAINFSEANNSLLSAVSSGSELAAVLGLQDVIYKGGVIEIASIEPLGNFGPSIPITIKLPEFATGTMQNFVS